MQKDSNKKSEVSLTLFIDDSEDSKMAQKALEAISEPCNTYDIRSLNVAVGDEIEAPILYAPEGIFRGWRQIQTFLKIPPSMRYRALVAET